jgi:hypothetical protein
MFDVKSNLTVRVGLFILSLAYFSFTFYQCTVALLHNAHPGTASYWVWVTDSTGILGMGFRFAAGIIAVLTSMFFLIKKDLSREETLMSLRWIVLLEALYWFVSLFPSGLWGLTQLGQHISGQFSGLASTFLINTTIPCLFESIALPIVLGALFFQITEKRLSKGAFKWGLIAGTMYIYVFWLNNLCNWVSTVMMKGTDYILLFPQNAWNLFSFVTTSFGLLALALFATYFSAKSIRSGQMEKTSLKSIGAIIVFFGLYFDGIFMLWIYAGSVGGWSTWYAWFLGHNADLWLMTLPLAGLPFLLITIKQNQSKILSFLTQGIGLIFYGVFWAAYAFALPTNNVLIDHDAYRIPLGIFGGILLILIFVSLGISALKRRETSN